MTSPFAAVSTAIDWRDRLVFAYLQEPPFCFREGDGVVADVTSSWPRSC